jgi:hypothetical protein
MHIDQTESGSYHANDCSAFDDGIMSEKQTEVKNLKHSKS